MKIALTVSTPPLRQVWESARLCRWSGRSAWTRKTAARRLSHGTALRHCNDL